jgi:leader peptidase (prepilin peptidase) / N-methyltransferase
MPMSAAGRDDPAICTYTAMDRGESARVFSINGPECCGDATGDTTRMTQSSGELESVNRTAAWIGCFYAAMALPLAFMSTQMPPAVMLGSLVLGAGLVALSAVDLLTLRLPDAITLPLAAVGLALAAGIGLEPSFVWRLGAAVTGYGIVWALNEGYRAIRGRAGMGLGDAKLLAVAGGWLGFEGLAATLLYSCAGALLFVAVRYFRGNTVGRDEPLPFGPFLAAAIWLVWLYGPLV